MDESDALANGEKLRVLTPTGRDVPGSTTSLSDLVGGGSGEATPEMTDTAIDALSARTYGAASAGLGA